MNRLTSRTDVIVGRTFATTYTYDGNDNIATIDYPSGRDVAYAYDNGNRITAVTDGSSQTYANQFTYHPSGAVQSYRAGNNLVHTQSFDNRYRVSALDAGGPLSLTYGYDDVGNVTSITDSRPGMNQGFGYDDLDRLTSVSGWNAADYVYDAVGNRLSKSGPNATTYTYNSGTNRLTNATGAEAESFGYDQNGNITSNGSGTYAYTPENMQQTATTSAGTTTYRYDGDNLRVAKVLPSSTLRYVHGQHNELLTELEEVCSQVGPVRDYIYAARRLIASVRFPALVATASMTTAASSAGESAGSAGVGVTVTTTTGAPLACAVTVNYSTANVTATAGADYSPAAGQLTFPSGTTSGAVQNVAIPLAGDVLDENDEALQFSLINVVGAAVGTATHTLTIQDDDAPPAAVTSDVAVTEGISATLATFTVTLSAASGRDLSVDYSTANITASAGSDYSAASGTLLFAAGVTTRTIDVTVLGDVVEEPTESFAVNLTNAVNVVVLDPQGVGTIADNDGMPLVAINDVSLAEGQSGAVNASFAVTLSFASSNTVTVNYTTANATAMAGRDYTATSGVLTFPPGTLSQPVLVPVLGDAVVENTETFHVNLSNANLAALGDPQGAGTIVTDDAFTDDPVIAQVTQAKAVHVTQLVQNIVLLRTAYGLGAYPWHDPAITAIAPQSTLVNAWHIRDLRDALEQVYAEARKTYPTLASPSYTDPTIVIGVTVIKADHINQLRAAVKAVP